ncbi:hypothetical protein LJ655_10155 [Paraburkholderia sp. MMS20-SJTN17]|uniref:Recombinase zinc beta ribbon domain-containing protein n=1 Tax=Paraburkholderia translucens TaxID=2886945 RepID=A0ABS8KBW2_9BURK|nr:hypothetical protein [Paraburkholderia sp. MMS20-SJTN17]MCC8402251.1 hypothetical protein [Paraburkholderia sp. MMS20-SJTN17]
MTIEVERDDRAEPVVRRRQLLRPWHRPEIQLLPVKEQTVGSMKGQSACDRCGSILAHNDSRAIALRTVFGKVKVPSPRLWMCNCTARQSQDNSRGNNFTSNKIAQRQPLIEQRIQRYLNALETADRTQPAEVEAKTERLREKIETLRELIRDLDRAVELLDDLPERKISLTDPDSRSMTSRASPELRRRGLTGARPACRSTRFTRAQSTSVCRPQRDAGFRDNQPVFPG